MGRKGRSSEGRKKIEMKKVESEDARQVCFSKRKKGVFAKAAELSTMCGAEVALLIHSPKGTPYTFGSPAVDKVFNRFLTGVLHDDPIPEHQHEIEEINLLSEEYMELTKRLEAADARRDALENQMKCVVSRAKVSEWVDNIDELSRDQLLQLLGSMYRTKCIVNERIHGSSCYNGAGSSDHMDVFTSIPPDAGMDLSLAPPAPDSPDESLNF